MFSYQKGAVSSDEAINYLNDKVKSQPAGIERDFNNTVLPVIMKLLEQYDGLSGIYLAGSITQQRAAINITIYANELGE